MCPGILAPSVRDLIFNSVRNHACAGDAALVDGRDRWVVKISGIVLDIDKTTKLGWPDSRNMSRITFAREFLGVIFEVATQVGRQGRYS